MAKDLEESIRRPIELKSWHLIEGLRKITFDVLFYWFDPRTRHFLRHCYPSLGNMWFWKKWVGGKPDKGIIQRLENTNAVKRGMGHREISRLLNAAGIVFPSTKLTTLRAVTIPPPCGVITARETELAGRCHMLCIPIVCPLARGRWLCECCLSDGWNTGEAIVLSICDFSKKKTPSLPILFTSQHSLSMLHHPYFSSFSLFASSWLKSVQCQVGYIIKGGGKYGVWSVIWTHTGEIFIFWSSGYYSDPQNKEKEADRECSINWIDA